MNVLSDAGIENFVIPEEEYLYSGHAACPGCGAALALRYVLKALGPKTLLVIGAGCPGSIAGVMPTSSFKVPVVQCAFMATAGTAAGLKAGFKAQGDDETTVLAWAGDGGTFDIGIQGLSGAAERDDDILFICNDNEAYMNTGIQRSSATPWGAWTTTSPRGMLKNTPKKNIMDIMVAHEIRYAATINIAFCQDLMKKVRKAQSIRGTKFIHLLTPCPTGWGYPTELAIEVSRRAVESKVFPLYEVENSEYVITMMPKKEIPVSSYLKLQGRFSNLKESDIEFIQTNTDRAWDRLLAKSKVPEETKYV